VPELGSLGSVRGVLSNEHPYREWMLNNRQLHSLAREAGMPVGSAFIRFFIYVVARIVPKHQKRSYPGKCRFNQKSE